ncbi:splicing regulatory glutamine/lysine-rich protein 1-like [Ptychodera flava]|uniref:splicing regulatory glutamine/lysine-rich protein 1-like n=1 Tax=Ptychodera flava TaxID=63121 RepID=UPI00396A02E4
MNETDETPTPVEMIDEESCGFDLYTDLVTSDVQTQFDKLKEEHAVCKKQLEEMSADYNKFKTQNKAYAEENEVLRKNISLLYLTAKSEVERKDYEIDRLRKKLQYAQSRIQELGMAQFQSNKDCSDKMGISNRLISLAYQGNQTEGDSGKRDMNSPSNDSGFRSEPVQYDIAAGSESKDRIDPESVNLMNPSKESHDLYCSRKKEYDDKVSGSRDRNPEKDKKSGIVTHTDSGHHAKHSEPRESHTKREKSYKPEEAGKHDKKYKTSVNHSDEHLHHKRQTSRSRSRSTCSPGHSKYENDTVPRHRKAASGSSDKKARRTKTPEQVDGTHDKGGAKRHHGKVKVEEHRRVGARKRSRSGSFEENPSKHIVRSGNNIKRRRTETSTSDEKRAHDRDKSSLPDERHRRKLGNESSERKEEGEKRKSSERRLDEKHNHKEQKLVSKRKRSTDEQISKQRRKSSEQRTKVPRNSSSKTVGKTETPAKAGSPRSESSNRKLKSSQTRSKESSRKADQHSNSAKERSHTKEGLDVQKPASRSSSEKKQDKDRIYETGTKFSNTDKKKEESLTAIYDTNGKEKQNTCMLQKLNKELTCSERNEDEESGDEKSLDKTTEEHLEKEMHRETETVNDANKLTSKT